MAQFSPALKESQVKALATDQSFERGQHYFHSGVIFNPTLQGNTLWADCEGTSTYQPRATLGPDGVEDSSCTCPYDWGGLCKHQVALLLTYIHNRDQFQVMQPLPELLAGRSRDDLLTLIERMVQRHPDLLDIVDEPVATPTGQPPDLDHYQRAVERVFRGNEMEAMAAALQALAEQGNHLAQQDDWVNAGDIYQLLLEAANDHYDHTVLDIDYDGAVGLVIQDIAQGLSDSLGQAENLDAGRRRLWIETFFRAVLKDLELGGMDYAYPARDAVIDHSTDANWGWIETQVRQMLRQPGQRSLGEWGRQSLVDLLVERAEQRGQTNTADAIVLELGTAEQRAFFHLRQGNFEEALALARSHFQGKPGLVTQFGDALVQAQVPDLALALVQEFN